MKNFILEIKNSVYNPVYYQELLQKPFSYSLKYFLKFFLILAFLATLGFAFFGLPKVKVFFNEVFLGLRDYYPAELALYFKNGQVVSNVVEPYFLELPASFKKELENEDYQFENFLVIDTFNEFSLSKFEEYQSLAWLTRDSVVFVDEQAGVRILPLEELPDFVLNQRTVEDFLSQVQPVVNLALNWLIPVVFIGFWLIGIWNLFWLLILALLVWAIAKLKDLKINYAKAYQFGLHLITLSMVWQLISLVFWIRVPFVYSLLALGLTFVNLKPQTTE
ncbi:MAG: DUF1189 family protein [Patescibacteria group bacterium]